MRLAGASARVTIPPRESRNERRGREAPSPHGVRVENKGTLLRDSLQAPPVIPGEGSISDRNVRVHASACEVLPKQVSSAHVGFVTDSLMVVVRGRLYEFGRGFTCSSLSWPHAKPLLPTSQGQLRVCTVPVLRRKPSH